MADNYQDVVLLIDALRPADQIDVTRFIRDGSGTWHSVTLPGYTMLVFDELTNAGDGLNLDWFLMDMALDEQRRSGLPLSICLMSVVIRQDYELMIAGVEDEF